MTAEARRRAEACFALARSSTFEGERSNAIERGTRIAEAAGLPLDSFDIPGRAKGPPASRYGEDLFTRPRSPAFTHGGYTREELIDTISRFRETMRTSTEKAYFDAVFGEERARRAAETSATDQQRERAIWNRAADFLSARGVRVYPVRPDWSRWYVDGEEASAWRMVISATLRGFQP